MKLIKDLFGRIKTMANLHMKKFKASQADLESNVGQLDQTEIINALIAYKKQNPVKFAAKKEALYKAYGLTEEIPQEVEDEIVKELEEKKKSVKKLNIV